MLEPDGMIDGMIDDVIGGGVDGVNGGRHEAQAFAESVAGTLRRLHGTPADWPAPGNPATASAADLTRALDELGWATLAAESGLAACAGLGAIELGRRLAPVRHVDRLLGGSPLAGDLVRAPLPQVVSFAGGRLVRRDAVRLEPVAAAGGLEVHRVLELGDEHSPPDAPALDAWLAAGIGYLAGLGEAALELTLAYVRQRRAFGTTLGGLGPVQQRLASAATSVRGIHLLAAGAPDADALAHAGPAVAAACADCHQVTGALGFTLEHPLHRFSQRARALAAFNAPPLDGLAHASGADKEILTES